MTQRERQIPEGGCPPSPAGARPQHPETACASSTRPDSCVTSLWEEWYHQAAPARRQAVVALAARQGVLLTRDLGLAEGVGPRAAGGTGHAKRLSERFPSAARPRVAAA